VIIGSFILNQNIFYTTNILFLKSIAECPCVATSYLSIFYRKYKYMHEIYVEIAT
jgi:hypothetical protein